jgi:hypothetical protein
MIPYSNIPRDVSPAAIEAVIRQAHADRAAFVAAILIGFGKKIKELLSGSARGAATPLRRRVA